jgi:hypothetical protein
MFELEDWEYEELRDCYPVEDLQDDVEESNSIDIIGVCVQESNNIVTPNVTISIEKNQDAVLEVVNTGSVISAIECDPRAEEFPEISSYINRGLTKRTKRTKKRLPPERFSLCTHGAPDLRLVIRSPSPICLKHHDSLDDWDPGQYWPRSGGEECR